LAHMWKGVGEASMNVIISSASKCAVAIGGSPPPVAMFPRAISFLIKVAFSFPHRAGAAAASCGASYEDATEMMHLRRRRLTEVAALPLGGGCFVASEVEVLRSRRLLGDRKEGVGRRFQVQP
jgi:hypothetical protein